MILPVLAVKDLDASVKFYTDKLGFKLDFSLAGPDGKPMTAAVSMAGNNGFLLNADSTLPQRGQGVVFMIYLAEDKDLDAYYAVLQAKGVHIVQPIKEEYWGDRVFSITDPNGFYLTFAKTVQQVSLDEIEKLAHSTNG